MAPGEEREVYARLEGLVVSLVTDIEQHPSDQQKMPENNMNICALALAVYLKITDGLPRHLHSGSLKMFLLLSI